MRCPRCGKEIGGYVEMGSKAYGRVSRGQCPHCGGSMPSGYSVGFARSTYSAPKKPETYDYDYVKETGTLSVYKAINVAVSGILGGLSILLAGFVAAGIIFAVVFILTGAVYYWLHYYALMPYIGPYGTGSATQTAPHGNGVLIGACILGVGTAVLPLLNSETPKGRIIGIGIACGAHLLLQIPSFLATLKRAKEAVNSAKRSKATASAMTQALKLMLGGNAKCGLCKRQIDFGDRFSWLDSGDGYAMLCEHCIPWEKVGHTVKIGDKTVINMDAETMNQLSEYE